MSRILRRCLAGAGLALGLAAASLLFGPGTGRTAHAGQQFPLFPSNGTGMLSSATNNGVVEFAGAITSPASIINISLSNGTANATYNISACTGNPITGAVNCNSPTNSPNTLTTDAHGSAQGTFTFNMSGADNVRVINRANGNDAYIAATSNNAIPSGGGGVVGPDTSGVGGVFVGGGFAFGGITVID